LFTEHHLSHAASAFFPSPYEEAAILTIDGVGEWATATICHGKGNSIKILKEMRFPHSVGLLYSAFTYYLGFRVNSGEYKLMGLAPYGNPNSCETNTFIKKIKDTLVSVKEDGSIWLNQDYFNYAMELTMVNERKWEQLFHFPAVKTDAKLEQKHCNLAYAIQKVTEEIVLKMAVEAKKSTGSDQLCMSGGVALNCVANSALVNEQIFTHIFIQPAAGDAGGALGAAQAAHYIYFEQPRKKIPPDRDQMQGAYLGPYYSDKEAIIAFKKHDAVFEKINSFQILCDQVAELIDKGFVVGWFQGRMEFGPRALGNRSILGDPRNKEMQKKMNLKIKYREGFRPFAPSVLLECSNEYFDLSKESPYMLLIANVKKNRINTLPDNYHDLDLWEKLYFQRSDVPSITHLDFSARVQTVNKNTNPKYWQLINAFREKTGYGLLVNTSFNVRGEPIVCSPEDAYKCFMRTEMDCLVVNDFFLMKTDQPDWKNREKWMVPFSLD
jgi:carbamoyltransferase